MARQVAFIISFLLVLSGTASGQDWLKLYEESISYYNAESYEEALESGENALVRYKREAELDHVNYRALLRQLSVTAYALENMNLAVDYAEQEVESWRSATMVVEATYIDALDILGVMYTGSNSFPAGIRVLRESLDLASNSTQKQPDEKALIEGHLALAEYGAGELNDSKVHFQSAFQVLDQLEELPGDYINFCYSYGILCIELSEFNEAISYLTLLFQWYDETELIDLIINANVGLGTAYTNTNELAKGEKYYTTAINGLEETLEPGSNSIIEAKKQLAHNLELQGRSEEANALLAEISTAVLADGQASESQALFLNSQATALLNTGDASAALTAYQQALDMLKSLDLERSDTYTTIGLNAVKAYDIDGKLLEANELATELLENQTEASLQYYLVVAELGSILRRQGDFAGAKEQFEIIANADRSSWPGNQTAQILNKTASFYQIEGSYNISADLYLEALASPGVEEDLTLYQSILFNYVTLLQAQSRFEEAELLLTDLKSTIGDDKPEIKLGLLRNLGSLAQAKGDYSTATAQFNEALVLAETIEQGKGPLYADILLRLATLDRSLGNYQNAEPKFIEVSEIIANAKGVNHPDYAGVSNNMGILYQQMGNYDKAEAKFQEAITIYKSVFGEANPDYVLSLENLATLYELIGEADKALEILSETLEANKLIYGEDNSNYAVSMHNYASLLLKTDRKDEAYAMLVKVLELQANSIGKMQPSYANSLQNLAILAQEQENYVLADSLIDEVLAIRGALFDKTHPSYTAALYSKAVLLQVTNNYDEAWEIYNEVIEQYLGQINKYFPSLSELEKNAFYAKLTPVVNRYKEFCIEYYANYEQDQEVLRRLYDVQLSTKALLLNAVNKTRERILNSGDTQLVADFNAWTNLKKQLVNYYSYTKDELESNGIDIPMLEEQANTLEKSLSKASSIFASEFEQADITWQSVAQNLTTNEAAVELLRVERNGAIDSVTYAALVLLPNAEGPRLATLPYGQTMESKFFNYYKNTVKYRIHDQRSFNVFWKPINDLLDDANTIYISADGVYNKININTIFNVNTDNYLIQDYFVKYISSTKDLINTKSTVATSSSILCMGAPTYDLEGNPEIPAVLNETQRSHLNMNQISPLPGTKVEVDYIDSLLTQNSWQVLKYTGSDALESKLKNYETSPKVIHLATHGFFMPDLKITDIESQTGLNQYDKNPLFRSGLLFAGASNIHTGVENDGVLTAYEAMNLYLDDTELVVLSACETALGDVKNGEGVYGLQRALVVAGVQRLIMSLWKVNDEATMELMQHFYTNWANGGDLYASLQKAQIDMMQKHEEPYYWGAFIMIGK